MTKYVLYTETFMQFASLLHAGKTVALRDREG